MADGCYARLNGSLLLKGQHEGQLVSVVGKVLSYDGQTVRCQCSDNQVVNMECDPNVTIDAHQGTMMELVGLASGNSNAVMTIYVVRPLSDNMDMDLYNRMLTTVLHNPKFSEYFGAPSS